MRAPSLRTLVWPLALALACLCRPALWAQDAASDDAFFIKNIHQAALTQGQAAEWLHYLSQRIGGRLSGSPEAAAAVEYAYQMLDTIGFDSVWLQPCTVPHWVRGQPELVRVASSPMGSFDLKALALGGSAGTGSPGIAAEVVEVRSLAEADSLGRAGKLRGKIVFYNRPMDPAQVNTFAAYGSAVDQRVFGPAKAAEHGAVGALVRSMSVRVDEVPHTGVTVFPEGKPGIAAVAISTRDAERLSALLGMGRVHVYIETHCRWLAPKTSYNVIGEIRGSHQPEDIILLGGHLDSWDVGTGAHDDGAGCVHSMDAIYLLRKLGLRPRRTWRCVLFMNEENGMAGAKAYAEASNAAGEFHVAAIESDRGGFTPRGFTCEAVDSVFVGKLQKAAAWLPLLEPYGLSLRPGGSGADVGPLKSQGGMLFGLDTDSQRYFDYHHTPADGLDAVNARELALGSAAMASLLYLIDKYGL